MADFNILEKVKTALGIPGTFNDGKLQFYIDEVKLCMKDSGVKSLVINSEAAAGVISVGVNDLWNYGAGETKLSDYFYKRVKQLSIDTENIPDPSVSYKGIVSIEKIESVGLIDTYLILYTDDTTDTFYVTNGEDGKGIQSLEKISSEGLIDTYLITFTDETTFEYIVTNGSAIAGELPSATAEQTTFQDVTSSEFVDITDCNINLTLDSSAKVLVIIPYSLQNTGSSSGCVYEGRTVLDGVELAKTQMSLVGTDILSSTLIRLTLNLSEGTHNIKLQGRRVSGTSVPRAFNTKLYGFGLQGAKGEDGKNGNGISNITKISTDGLVDTYKIELEDLTSYNFEVTNGQNGTSSVLTIVNDYFYINGVNTNVKAPGEDGNGIANITKIGTVGLVDTYKILLDDASYYNFTVTNGKDGTSSVVTIVNDYFYINGVNTNVKAKGTDGISITNIAKTGTVDLVDTYTITFSNNITTTFTVTNGRDGQDGADGYTPVRGTDYWTVTDITTIETYCNNYINTVILEGAY